MKILTLDIGGTSIKSGLAFVDDKNSILLSEKRMTKFDPEDPSSSIKKSIEKYELSEFSYVAISATGVINNAGIVVSTNGKINNYLGLDIKQLAESITNCQTIVINDLTAIGYAQLDYLSSDDITLLLALGTGIGGCLIYKGEILEGAAGAFAEVGQLQIGDAKFEELASTKALVNLAQSKYNLKVSNGIEFFEKLDNEQNAQDCFDEWILALSKGVKQLLYCYNPNRILLAGGISEQAKIIIPELKKCLNDTSSVYIDSLDIEAVIQKNDAGLIGAVKKLRRDLC